MALSRTGRSFLPLGLTLSSLILGCSLGNANPGEKEFVNRLIHEKSPYLLQHAHNPVDWYPWGDAAFKRARRENKPIFLSIGYSTCHWCHVMERESFSNPGIAEVLNRFFVSIKVDREERPDVDQVYMTYVQATTGSGGWPLSVFLTPDLEPIFGGTYFPAQASGGRPGFKEILERVATEWTTHRDQVVRSSKRITKALRELSNRPADESETEALEFTSRGFSRLKAAFDSRHGGFGRAPKFPRPAVLQFLLRHWKTTGETAARDMVVQTLKAMAAGGIRDHLGGGFHRYSTDARWFLPHFEKMLYDQAQLATLYLDANLATSDPELAQVGREILDYLLRQMAHPGGGFYSAEDADSLPAREAQEKREGAFYVWSESEISRVLGPEAKLFEQWYGVLPEGNVIRDPFSEFRGKNVLYLAHPPEAAVNQTGGAPSQLRTRLGVARQRLLEVRRKRPRPLLDDKILAAWNGLAITAFSRGFQVLGETRYLEAAQNTALFLRNQLWDGERKRLYRRFREGESAIDGFASDYIFVAQGLLDLYETSLDGRWLLWAMELSALANQRFRDVERGGFFSSDGSDQTVLLRLKDDFDGALPTPSSVAALNLVRLAQMTGDGQWKTTGQQCFRAFAPQLERAPDSLPTMLSAIEQSQAKGFQILIAGEADSPGTQAILRQVHRRYLPSRIILLADGGPVQKRLSGTLDILESLRRIGGKSTAYVCQNYVCQLPTNDPEVVGRLLDGMPGQNRR